MVLGNSGFVSHLVLVPQELFRLEEHCIVCASVCLKLLLNWIFCTNLAEGFVESFPDMIFHYCKSFTALIFVGRGSEWTAYED